MTGRPGQLAASLAGALVGTAVSLLVWSAPAVAAAGVSYRDRGGPDGYGGAAPVAAAIAVGAAAVVAVVAFATVSYLKGALAPGDLSGVLAAAVTQTVHVDGMAVPVMPSTGASVAFGGRVLLVGEGNFSFTQANLALGRNVPGNVTATAYSPDGRYPPDALARADWLHRSGVDLRFQVDARTLPSDLAGGAAFNSILFQFPHPGGRRANAATAGSALLASFFANAAARLVPGGQVALTIRNQYYLSLWAPLTHARAAGLRLLYVTDFQASHYPGYVDVTAARAAAPSEVPGGLTLVFTRP